MAGVYLIGARCQLVRVRGFEKEVDAINGGLAFIPDEAE
jgi:hypothetical protein